MNGKSSNWKSISIYGGAALLCCGLTYWLLDLWHAEFRIPFVYGGGDELPICLWIKGLKDNPWIFHNARLGMPFGLEMYDYPLPETLHLAIFKLLDLTTRHFGKVLNLFYLATFPAILLCSLYALRGLGLGYPAALFSSFLYTFLPYHFRRSEAHLFLSAYYAVPLILLVTLRLFGPAPPFFAQATDSAGGFRRLFRWDWGVIVVCAILGSTGTGYYAFFSCFLLAVAGAAAATYRRRFTPALSAIIVITLICITVALNVAPNLLFGRRDTAARPATDAEIYGLKVAQLLLPIGGHRVPALGKLRAEYNNAPLVNENDAASLGIVGAAGFLFLLGWIGFRLMRSDLRWFNPIARELLDGAALLTLTATLVGTIGGFGSIFALIVNAQFRSYNRISVYIAFLSLLAMAVVIDRFLRTRVRTTRGRVLSYGALLLLLICGILDQTTPLFVPDYRLGKKIFEQDESFVHNVEAVLPPQAMVFQLPYMPFPETGGVHKMTTYDLARGYLHSENLRWSYAAMKGEPGDAWQRAVTSMPIPDMVDAIVGAGFAGIYLDRFGFEDNGAQIERDLSQILDEGPLVANSRLVFFSLEHYKTALRKKMSDAEWKAYQDRSYPPFVVYQSGFYPEEVTPGRVWRWSQAESSLRLFNLASGAKTVVLDVSVASAHTERNTLQITSPVLNKHWAINRDGIHLREEIVLPVGETLLRLKCDAPLADAPTDPRRMTFGIENLVLKPE
jgi:phosphoglycerol transferase